MFLSANKRSKERNLPARGSSTLSWRNRFHTTTDACGTLCQRPKSNDIRREPSGWNVGMYLDLRTGVAAMLWVPMILSFISRGKARRVSTLCHSCRCRHSSLRPNDQCARINTNLWSVGKPAVAMIPLDPFAKNKFRLVVPIVLAVTFALFSPSSADARDEIIYQFS